MSIQPRWLNSVQSTFGCIREVMGYGMQFLWVVLSKLLGGWEACAHLMQPATVKRWHTTAFRLFWRWKSRRRTGRPPISRAMQDLIGKLSRENPLWGAERIRDTLLLLNYDPPCDDTIRK
jgi:putative transposase